MDCVRAPAHRGWSIGSGGRVGVPGGGGRHQDDSGAQAQAQCTDCCGSSARHRRGRRTAQGRRGGPQTAQVDVISMSDSIPVTGGRRRGRGAQNVGRRVAEGRDAGGRGPDGASPHGASQCPSHKACVTNLSTANHHPPPISGLTAATLTDRSTPLRMASSMRGSCAGSQRRAFSSGGQRAAAPRLATGSAAQRTMRIAPAAGTRALPAAAVAAAVVAPARTARRTAVTVAAVAEQASAAQQQQAGNKVRAAVGEQRAVHAAARRDARVAMPPLWPCTCPGVAHRPCHWAHPACPPPPPPTDLVRAGRQRRVFHQRPPERVRGGAAARKGAARARCKPSHSHTGQGAPPPAASLCAAHGPSGGEHALRRAAAPCPGACARPPVSSRGAPVPTRRPPAPSPPPRPRCATSRSRAATLTSTWCPTPRGWRSATRRRPSRSAAPPWRWCPPTRPGSREAGLMQGRAGGGWGDGGGRSAGGRGGGCAAVPAAELRCQRRSPGRSPA